MTTAQNDVQTRSESMKFALAAAELAANTRAEDVVLLDLRGRSPVTEFFIIASGTSPRQMRTVAEEIQELGKRMGFKAWQTSGFESARWILVDCVNVVTHVFDGESRDFYDLELLWGDCPRIDWRKELGLPPAPEGAERVRTRTRFGEAAGMDEMEAEEEEARLEGRDLDDEEGDADVDEDAEVDAPIVMELPDESTGSNSVEFVEIDPPTKRRKRGRAVYPTPIGDEDSTEEERGMRVVSGLGAAEQSLDEDDVERRAENAADADVEDVSDEDLPARKIVTRPMGGVSAGMSSTTILDEDEEEQREDRDADDAANDHRDEIPEMHEAAAETTSFAKPVGDKPGVDVSAESESERGRGRVLRNRAGMRGPKQAAPGPVNISKAKAGVVKGKMRKGVESGIADAPAVATRKTPVVKMKAKKKAAKAPARKAAAKKPATKKAPARKAAAKKGAAKGKGRR